MKKERTMKVAILSVVFVVAIIVFSYCTNRGSADMAADMSVATLPTLSFEMNGKEVNMLVGHKREMNMASMRDSVAVLGDKGTLTMNVHHADNGVEGITYEVYTLDGEKQLLKEEIDKVKESVQLELKSALNKKAEAILKIVLHTEATDLYYYTRIAKNNEYHVKECLDYTIQFHNNLIAKKGEDDVRKVLEPDESGDNTTLAHVTIHSNLKHVMWGDLNPKVLGETSVEITEVTKSYTCIQLNYRVQCAGDNNKEENYIVKEFLKVSYGKERMYLLEYDRKMEEEFQTSNVVLGEKGIILGVADSKTPYKVNEEGNVVAFVQANQLWSYHKKDDKFALVFSFAESEKEDIRHRTDKHSIRILSMEDNGNMTFSVNGYMNRGIHEGESGIAIYYFNMEQNVTEQEAFIPSSESLAVIEKDFSRLAYYNKDQDVLYVMAEGSLLKIGGKEERQVLLEGLKEGSYVTSEDGHLFAYQREEDKKSVTEVWNFAKDKRATIEVKEGEQAIPLGFVGDDFVYGLFKAGNEGQDTAGTKVRAMHRLEICNEKQKVVKTYEKADAYILGVTIDGNMITLRQGAKQGNHYTEIAEDYITNHEASGSKEVSLQSYWTDLKETQYQLVFAEGIKSKRTKILKPKQVLKEQVTVVEVGDIEKDYFYVYGLGEQAGVFEDAGDALALASSLSGVVISPEQNCVWEDGNKVAWYRNFNVDRFTPRAGDSTLMACIRRILSYEGKSAEGAMDLNQQTPEQVLMEHIGKEVVRFTGCAAKEMRYLIDKGVPVIGIKNDSQAILLIGYDAETITYVEPSSGSIFISTFDKIDALTAGSGHTYIGYAR